MKNLSTEVRARIADLEVLPVASTIVLRLLEFSKDPGVGARDYASVIETDPSLTCRLIALTNSSAAAIPNRVSTVKQAVTLLGTSSVHAVAISHLLLGLQKQWKLDQKDVQAYWEASLYKATAAKLIADQVCRKRSGEAYAMALLQDVAIGLFVAVAGPAFAKLLRDSGLDIDNQLNEERARFDLDHAQAGCLIANRLGLQDPHRSIIAFHHDYKSLTSAARSEKLALALSIASLLPHDVRSWKPVDTARLDAALAEHFWSGWANASVFLNEVGREFAQVTRMLNKGSTGAPPTKDVMEQASLETTKHIGGLVEKVLALTSSQRRQRSRVTPISRNGT